MALVIKKTERLHHPTEEDAWFDIRLPLSASDTSGMQVTGAAVSNQAVRLTLDLLAAVIAGWSYDAPITVENVGLLDLDTFVWLCGEITGRSGIRSEEEKKDSDDNSSPPPTAEIPQTQPESSPSNSLISASVAG